MTHQGDRSPHLVYDLPVVSREIANDLVRTSLQALRQPSYRVADQLVPNARPRCLALRKDLMNESRRFDQAIPNAELGISVLNT